LKLLDLEEAADKRVSKYSKGMAQRLGVAQALLHDPDLLILDEPTASLDPVGRNQFRELLLELKGRGKTILISSHILSEVESVCDRVAILEKGALKRVGTLQELSTGGSARLVVKDVPGNVMNALAATTAEVTWFQGQVTIACRDDSVRQTVEELLRENHIEILRRESEAQSLNEIFFSTIEREPRA
jgi:ABC-2 type transport system ATP-binding protein